MVTRKILPRKLSSNKSFEESLAGGAAYSMSEASCNNDTANVNSFKIDKMFDKEREGEGDLEREFESVSQLSRGQSAE